jgi:hypothetical protein
MHWQDRPHTTFSDYVQNFSTSAIHLAPAFINAMEAGQEDERRARKKLQSMEQHLQRLDDTIESDEQNLTRKKQERAIYKAGMQSVEEQVESAIAIQRNAAVNVSPRTRTLLKRFADFLPDEKPIRKRQQHQKLCSTTRNLSIRENWYMRV